MTATPLRVLVVGAPLAEQAQIGEQLAAAADRPVQIDVCADPAAVRSGLAAHPADVYLVHDRFGEHDGLALVREIVPLIDPRPVLVLAHAAVEADDRVAAHAGAAAYLVLGECSPATLARAVRYAMARAHPRRDSGAVVARLRESEQRLELAVEAASLGLWDWDLANQQLYYSPHWKAQVGHTDATLPTSTETWEGLLHPDDRQRCVTRLREFIRSSAGTYEDEFRLRHRAGGYRWIQSRAGFVRDARGRVARMIGIHVDVTERREAEEAVRRLNAELEQRVADRTAELEAANRELEAFSYSVSHDLRAPLRSVEGFARALEEDCRASLSTQGLHYLDRVRGAAQRMGGLIDDLLALARVTRAEMQRRSVDLSAMAAEVADDLRRDDPRRHVALEIAPRLRASGDPMLLRLALENLLGNAWKYTGRRARAHIAFGAETRNGERVFYVRDDGAGFDPAHADRLFGAFQRLHHPGEFEGSGIGLATVRRIVERHGGRVWAAGASDAGATFYFTLPRRHAAAA